jgi:hypothetical protein
MEWYDPLVGIGTLISAIVSMIVAFFIYDQQKTLKKQTANLESQTFEIKKEIYDRMRPWIKLDFDLTHIFTDKGKTREKKSYFSNQAEYGNIVEARYLCTLENIGPMPATRLYVKVMEAPQLFTKQMLWSKKVPDLTPIPVMPNEKLTFKFKMSVLDYFNSEKLPWYYGIHVGYFIDENTSATIGKIWRITNHSIETEEYWFDEPR